MKREHEILVILNPAARGERANSLRHRIARLPGNPAVRLTESPGDAEAQAERGVQQGFRAIVAAGGDGTVNEVVNGLAGSNVAFGILPLGTMNVFAAELGIPQNLERAWAVVRVGAVREVDLPLANGEHFVQLAGVGLDAEVVGRTTPDSKKALGPMSYLITLAQVAAQPPPLIRILPSDGPERAGCFVLVGNGRLYGGPFVLFKKARLDDGLLDVLVFQNQTHWDIVRYVQAIAFGSHPDLPDVEYFQTRSLRLTSLGRVPVELDGEMVGELPVEFGFAERRLRVFAPPEGPVK